MQAGRAVCPSLVIMNSQSVKTTERGGTRGFDGHKRIKGRKRHILVDTLGIPIACRVEPANMSDQRGAERLLGGRGPMFPDIRTIMADAGNESCKLARELMRRDSWKLVIVKRNQRAFKITGLTWICGAHLRMAQPQSPTQQRLRIHGPDIRDPDRYRNHPHYAQPTRSSVNTSQTPSYTFQHLPVIENCSKNSGWHPPFSQPGSAHDHGGRQTDRRGRGIACQ